MGRVVMRVLRIQQGDQNVHLQQSDHGNSSQKLIHQIKINDSP